MNKLFRGKESNLIKISNREIENLPLYFSIYYLYKK